jgi:hydrogenase maturation protease
MFHTLFENPVQVKKIGLIGIGNRFMGDDGIGPLLVEHVRVSGIFNDRICFINGGTGGFSLVHELARLEAAVVVDAGDFDGISGEYRIFSVRDMLKIDSSPGRRFSSISVHEWNLIKTIELSILMRELPDPFYIMVIQPHYIALCSGISSTLEIRLPHYEKVLRRLLSSFLAVPRDHPDRFLK